MPHKAHKPTAAAAPRKPLVLYQRLEDGSVRTITAQDDVSTAAGSALSSASRDKNTGTRDVSHTVLPTDPMAESTD
ncbi:hypothetical protein FRC09_008136 [Ceratobasidium sp. 395]|nr:hypothetical protein FRC09_008136 [Ceratobasidium sp. 395]